MSSESNSLSNKSNSESDNQPKKLGPCCVCKETKKLRDQCFFQKSQDQCNEEIYLHNECLKTHGFEPVLKL